MPKTQTRKMVLMGLMLALMVVFALVERAIPLPMLPPGVNLGLANIIVMYFVFFVGAKGAFAMAVAKAGLTALTRGLVAGLLSLCGSVLSVLVVVLLLVVFKNKMSYLAAGISGAVAHNMGQLAVASLLLSFNALYYAPILVVAGVITGAVTGSMLTVLLPAFQRLEGLGSKDGTKTR